MPKDPIMLLSYVNMKLRDESENLKEFCNRECVDEDKIKQKLSSVGYFYDEVTNQFV
jgi:hypothetical protein